MHISLDEFCACFGDLRKLNVETALLLLWFHDYRQTDITLTAGALTKIFQNHHLGAPNSTQLAKAIRATKMTIETRTGFKLKPGSRRIIRNWLPQDIDGLQPQINHREGYLPEAIWINTRGYIESVAKQLNGCNQNAYYDAALVMLRRLFETLIIEVYEHLKRQSEIQISDGNYLMLSGLVDRIIGKGTHQGVHIGRNTKNALEAVKALGDRAAHDRRFRAVAADLSKIQMDVRSGAQDLVEIASLKKH